MNFTLHYIYKQIQQNLRMRQNSVALLDMSTHTLNTSSSKHKFSFPKANRFGPSRKSLCDSYYEVPTTKTQRAPSFGYGNKDIGLRNDPFIPPVATYNLQYRQRKKGFSFGSGREQMILGGPLADSIAQRYIPGPGNYKEKTTLAQNTITLKSRLPDQTFNHLLKNPGPGAYHLQQLGSKNYYVTSNHKNNTNGKISPTSRLQPINKSVNIGPGQYNTIQSDIKPNGRYILSNNESTKARYFDKSPRPKLTFKHIEATPAPNSYSIFSQFGPI